MEITFNALQCQNYETSSQREWLITNGLGGYASSTVSGANTRRYHGLLVAALRPPTGRFVLLSKVEERVQIGDRELLLSANQYVGTIFPQGYLHLERFDLHPVPTFTYYLSSESRLIKRIFMPHGANTVYLTWELRGDLPIHFTLSPLIAFKFYHHEMAAHPGFPLAVHFEPEQASVLYDGHFPPLRLMARDGSFQPSGHWYYRFEHLEELNRGLDYLEDLYNPCLIHFYLKPGERAELVCTVEATEPPFPDEALQAIETRQSDLIKQAGFRDPVLKLLTLASDAFCVKTPQRATIVAGYHWFTDWTRDTMISLPGLCLVTKRFDFAREVLESYLKYLDKGMMPNRFPDALEQPEYNTVDGTLWYFNAVYEYLSRRWDEEFAKIVLPVLKEIVEWHWQGTRHNIHLTEHGLLYAGEPGWQLTWMDAKVGEEVITPRIGMPVEVNALWVNALCILEWLEQQLGRSGESYGRAAIAAAEQFKQVFWCERKGYFYDVVGNGEPDDTLRPNQLLAISLPFAPATEDQARSALLQIQANLLIPFGVRTLSPDHPNYRGRYEGPVDFRDRAYHQGTAWAWLLGPFLTAYLKVTGDKMGARRMLRPLREHLREAGIGFISEIFSGDPPHEPAGCIAQAWSVGEVLRVMVDELEIK